MRFRLTVILLFIYLSIFGQETGLAGRCIDLGGKGLSNVKIGVQIDSTQVLYTDELGYYFFKANQGDSINLIFRYAPENQTRTLQYVVKGEKNEVIPNVQFQLRIQEIGGVNVHRDIEKPFEIPELIIPDLQLIPSLSGVEGILKYTTAASSNNELTSNYNVRGGSYDENLVYVNGFQIYRPFLTRSGQQEGMSFINSALVEAIRFSGGGFDARYGDKMSSVLDIDYKKPDTLSGSFMASMLGIEAHVEQQIGKRKYFNYLAGARYRSNGYFLNSLPTKGAYNPVFLDGQLLTNLTLNENWTWSMIGHFSSNNYRFIPQSSETDFGTANEAYSFRVYFEGQEETQFTTMMGGTKFNFNPDKVKNKLNLDFYATVFNSNEREYFDVLGEYFINQLETDPSKEEFGDSIAVLGVGGYLHHARNRLNATIMNIYHDGRFELNKGFAPNDSLKFRSQELKWGINYQHDDFYDILSEWRLTDSAGYSIPQGDPEIIELTEVIKGNLALQANRITSYGQLNAIWAKQQHNKVVTLSRKYKDSNRNKYKRTFTDTIPVSTDRWALNVGTRAGYTTVNSEFFVTPRVSITYYPRAYMVKDSNIVRRNMSLRFATGLYYQPPFYRELRTFNGQLNTNVKAQKSYHAIVGYDMYFDMWNRDQPFKFTAEAFYKYIWDLNPFEVENVRTRYYASNDAIAYAYGADFNIHGEFVPGIESFFKVGLLSTKEDLLNDSYTEYYNAAGNKIIFGYSEDQVVVDSAVINPGYIPRPTDQWVNIGALVQDQMPNIEQWSVQMGLNYGTPLPYGPPDFQHYKDTLRSRSYFRVDLGTSYDFIYGESKKSTFWNRNFTDAILSFEVYNLLGVNNVLSKQWVQDTQGTYYSIPNYLTSRRFNLKLIVRF